jgi:hypothetical protein
MNAITLATKSLTDLNSPRLSSRRARIEKNSSTWFSHKAWVGVERAWNRGWSTNHQRVSRAMCEEPLSSTAACKASSTWTTGVRQSRAPSRVS